MPMETQRRNEAKQLDILSNFEEELPTTSTAQANSQCLVASLLMRHRYLKDLFCQILIVMSLGIAL